MDAHLYYKPKILQVGEFKEAFEKAVTELLGSDAEITVIFPRQTNPTGVRDEIRLSAESLRVVCDLNKIELTLIAHSPDSMQGIYISFRTVVSGEAFLIYASGEESLHCFERAALNLGLQQTERPEDEFEVLESRVTALEKAAKNVERTPKCFISFKFGDAKTVTQVDRLKRLLAALHIEWVTGEQFEPRKIEDKVKAKLRADIDFIIAVITKAGESNWIRDELADANARALWVVVLLEDGATFDKGIFGTLEYIPFDLAIDQTFLALLEGVNFIKAEISARNNNHSADAEPSES